MYGDKGWGKVGTWESLANELINSGSCNVNDGREERHRIDFTHSPGVITDVNGDGTLEVVVTGNVVDCAVPPHIAGTSVSTFSTPIAAVSTWMAMIGKVCPGTPVPP